MLTHIKVTVDLTADCAYIRLSDTPVARSVEATDAVIVDLDDMGIVVGVEVLELAADLPFTQLVERFHVHSEVVEDLRRIQPSIAGYLILSQSGNAVRTTSNLRVLATV